MKRSITALLHSLLRHTALTVAVVLLLSGCVSGPTDDLTGECVLTITINPATNTTATRSNEGEISATTPEKEINTLQLWVFHHTDGNLLGYLELDQPNLESGAKQYQIAVDPSLAGATDRHVDLYAVANVNSGTCGITLERSTSRATLDAAVIESNYFGTVTQQHTVPDGGLPMTGVLKNEEVQGSFPALHIGTSSEVATLQLVRAVSRIRFYICSISDEKAGNTTLKSIETIEIDKEMIPNEEYLFLTEPFDKTKYQSNIPTGATYNTTAMTIDGCPDLAAIPKNDNPLEFFFDRTSQTAQEYENFMDKKVNEGKLATFGLTYLRESDKRLTGTIKYTVVHNNNEEHKEATFEMDRAGDFSRDRSWTVYTYFMGDRLHVFSVVQVGMKEWTNGGSQNHEVYNW